MPVSKTVNEGSNPSTPAFLLELPSAVCARRGAPDFQRPEYSGRFSFICGAEEKNDLGRLRVRKNINIEL